MLIRCNRRSEEGKKIQNAAAPTTQPDSLPNLSGSRPTHSPSVAICTTPTRVTKKHWGGDSIKNTVVSFRSVPQ